MYLYLVDSKHYFRTCRLGDVVTRLPGATRGTILTSTDDSPASTDTSSSPAAPQLEYVGEIVTLRDGLITVAWADGVVSRVGPQNVLVASSEDDGDEEVEDESFYGSDEEDAESWETLSGDGSEQEGPPPEDPANEVGFRQGCGCTHRWVFSVVSHEAYQQSGLHFRQARLL